MPPGAENSRGRGGKFNKAKRGGGKHFSRNLTPLDADGNPISMWADPRDFQKDELDPDASSEGSAGEEGSEDEEAEPEQEMTREERRAAAKARKEAAIAKKSQRAAEPGDMPPSSSEEDEETPSNPNHITDSKAQAASSSKMSQPELSRREREAIQAQQARERYQKLHAEGKTDEARADLARLKLIREEREAAAARKAAEKEEKDAAEQRRLAEMNDRERKKREAALGSAGKKGGKKVSKS